MNIYALRPQVREALWLWLLLNAYTQQSSEEWLPVSNGDPVSDTELAAYLICPEDTACYWRERLERVGLIRSTLVRGRSRRIEMRNLHPAPESAELKQKIGLVN